MLTVFFIHVLVFIALNVEIDGDDSEQFYVTFNYAQAKSQLESLGSLVMKAYDLVKEVGTMAYDRINTARS